MHNIISGGILKKILVLVTLLFVLISCGEEDKKVENIVETEICKNSYKIGEVNKTNLKLKGVVVSDDTKNVSSPSSGTVTYLNCEAGKTVYPKTLIGKITPDYNNPTIANLNIQKSSLVSQKLNIESLKTTTINNFDNQISDLKFQIDLLKNNMELTKKSGDLSKLDLNKQIEALEDTLKNLEKNLKLLFISKKDSLEQLNISKQTLYTNIKNTSKDNLLKIDEIFGITEVNKDLNNIYDKYLGTKNTILLSEFKNDFRILNKKDILKMSDLEISLFLGDLIKLNEKSQSLVKLSIVNIHFPQSQIDTFYGLFLTYSKNITDLKNSWESLDKNKDSTITNFDTQISNLKNQIQTTKTNLENIKTNKIGSVNTANELQLSNLDAQLKTLNTNLDNLISNKKSQIISLDNQILQLNQSIYSLNSSLSIRNVYSGITGIVKQKSSSKGNTIGTGMSLCQIIPNAKSTKIKIYSPIELNLGDKLTFEFNGDLYEIIIENALIYKDAVTQNYVYESNYLDRKYFKDGEILNLNFENNNLDNINTHIENNIKNIPVSYVKNKIDGNYVKILSGSLVIDKKVKLGDINGNMIEIKSGIKDIVKICK